MVSLREKWWAILIHKTAFSSFAVLCERCNLIAKIHFSFSTCPGGREGDPAGHMRVPDPAEQQSLPLSPSPSQRLLGWLARGPRPGVGAQLHPSDGDLCFPSKTRAKRCCQEEEDLTRDPKSLAGSLTRSGSCLPSLAVPSHCRGGMLSSPAPSSPQRCPQHGFKK